MNLLIAAAAVTAPAVVVMAGPASAVVVDPIRLCGPQVPISSTNNSSSPLSLTVPQYSGALSSASMSIEATSSFQSAFFNSATGTDGPGDATLAYLGEAQVLQASGPGLAALADVASAGTAFNGSPGSFSAGAPQPALPSGVAATEAVGAAGTSTGTETPDWAALGYPFVANATAPVSATGTLSYTTNQAASVPAASLGSYQGPGNVTLTAIDDDEQTVSANAQQPWFNGGTITTTIQACATYLAVPPVLPEAPMVALIPVAAVVVGGGILFARRRRAP